MHAQTRTPLRGNFVLLSAGRLKLVLPQEQVGAAHYLERHQAGAAPVDAGAQGRRYLALSESMGLLPECPPGRFIATSLGTDRPQLAWCWDELRVLIDAELLAQPLPPVLCGMHTPVQAYVEHEGALAYLSSAARVTGFALASRG